jgi:tripartite-type tricarboxylate transporter receptor subunit TctC
MWRVVFACLSAWAAAMTVSPVAAESYPTKPVHIVVTTPPGGLADITGRTLADELRKHFNEAFIVENRPGASGKIGTEYVARAAPDGYTLLFTNPSSHTLPTLSDPHPTFDPIADFAPIARTGVVAFFLVVRPDLPVKTVGDLIALARKEPGKLNFANSSIGGSSHYAAVLLATTAGIDVVHVPDRGEKPVALDLMAGQVDMAFLAGAKPYIEAGQLRAIGVSSLEPFPTLPDVPPLASTGLPGFSFYGWHGMLAPAHTPPAIIATLNHALNEIVKGPRLAKFLDDNGAAPAPSGPPEELTKAIREDLAIGRKLIGEHKIKLD